MNNKIYYFFIAVTFLLSSCAAVYVPNAVNAPMLQKKGDLNTNINTGMNGFDIQGAYAVTNHLGVMLNGSYANQKSDSTRNFHQHAFAEAGAGYFLKLSDKTVFDVYGAAGFGSVAGLYGFTFFSYIEDIVRGNYYRAVIQPSIGSTTEYLDLNFALRGGYINAYNLDNTKRKLEPMTATLVEPVFTIRSGYKNLKIQNQVGFSILSGISGEVKWRWLILNVGVSYKFNTNKKAVTLQ